MEKIPLTRWGEHRRADSDFARKRIIAAACASYRRVGFKRTSLADIAREARVTRATVYRYFSNCEAVLNTVIMQETEVVAAIVTRQMEGVDSFEEFMVRSIVDGLRMIQSSPVLRLFFAEEESGAVVQRLFSANYAVVVNLVVDFFRPRFEQARREGLVRENVDLREFLDWELRMATIYLLSARIDDLEKMLRRFVMPAILVKPR